MQPYGKYGFMRGIESKIDYHVILKNRKVGSWWEDCYKLSKTRERQEVKKQIKNEMA